MEFASKVESFIEASREKMSSEERAAADAKASALFDEFRAKQ